MLDVVVPSETRADVGTFETDLAAWSIRILNESTPGSSSSPSIQIHSSSSWGEPQLTDSARKLQLFVDIADTLKHRGNTRVIGVVAKPSRSKDLASRSLLSTDPHPLPCDPHSNSISQSPAQSICFIPLDFPHLSKDIDAYSLENDANIPRETLAKLTGLLDGLLLKATDFLRLSSSPLEIDPKVHISLSPSLQAFLSHCFPASQPGLACWSEHGHVRATSDVRRLIENPSGLACVVDREDMIRILSDASESDHDHGDAWTWRPPLTCGVSECSVDALRAAVNGGGLQYPLLVKARVGCGPPQSHNMSLVLNEEGLSSALGHVPFPCVLQEFRDHNAQQLKVYVVGSEVFWSDKKSLPDLSNFTTTTNSAAAAVQFNTLENMPTSAADLAQRLGVTVGGEAGAPVLVSSVLSRETIVATADAIRTSSGLSIFGFDIIVPKGDVKQFLVVDLNAFPSFKGFDPQRAATAIASLFAAA